MSAAIASAPPARRTRSPRPTLEVHHGHDADEPPTVVDVPRLDVAALVAAVVNDGAAAVPLATLAAGLGVDADDVRPVADDAAAAGWLVWWHRPAEDADAPPVPCLALTPLMAERAGLELDAASGRWVPIGKRSKIDPDPWRARRGRTFVNLATDVEDAARVAPGEPNAAAALERLAPDYRELEPWDAADAILTAERIAAINAARNAQRQAGGPRLPRLDTGPAIPRLILGLGIPWPPAWAAGEPCPGCGGKRLPALAYCAVCDTTSNEARTQAAAARRAEVITTPPRPVHVPAYATHDEQAPAAPPVVADAPAGLVGGLERSTPATTTGKAGRKAGFKPSNVVMVRLLKPMGQHASGETIELRPSIATAYVTVGAAMPIAAP